MNIASIDIGTNTAILLIVGTDPAKGGFTPLLNEYRVPRVGKNVTVGTPISEENLERLISVLIEYREICARFNCESIRAVATNAFRIASNSKEVIREIKHKTGLTVDVISGENEAELTFSSAYLSTNGTNGKLLIDIGGGSTELVYGKPGRNFRRSFQMGVVTHTEKLLNENTELGIQKLQNEVSELFNDFTREIPPNPETIAVAGTPTTLSCIVQNQKEYRDELVDGSKLNIHTLDGIINELKFLSPSEVRTRYGQVVDGRADILLAGVVILKSICEKLKIEEVTVSSRGLRYGVAIEMVNELQKKRRK